MKLREFDNNDWDAFSGAERGPKGEEPQVAYGLAIVDSAGRTISGLEATVIADNQGLFIAVYDEEGTDYGNWSRVGSNIHFNIFVAEKLVEDGEIDFDQLNRLGFREG